MSEYFPDQVADDSAVIFPRGCFPEHLLDEDYPPAVFFLDHFKLECVLAIKGEGTRDHGNNFTPIVLIKNHIVDPEIIDFNPMIGMVPDKVF